MDEEGGGRGWEKLAPEEREKLLRERRHEGEGGRGWGASGGSGGSGAPPGSGQGFVLMSPSR